VPRWTRDVNVEHTAGGSNPAGNVDRAAEPLLPGSMGRIAAGYEIAVVDEVTGRLCGEGEPGGLWLRGTRGVQLFLEYFDDPDANQDANQDGWCKTGDIAMQGPG
jgi:crotonobetaine/carnitine-CoA ligase